jgi:hypothetical protein
MERAYKVPTAAASLNEPLGTPASASLNEPLGTPAAASLNEPLGTPRLQPWVSQHSAEGPSSLPQAGVKPQAKRQNCLPSHPHKPLRHAKPLAVRAGPCQAPPTVQNRQNPYKHWR